MVIKGFKEALACLLNTFGKCEPCRIIMLGGVMDTLILFMPLVE
jgi:hypothetical protein